MFWGFQNCPWLPKLDKIHGFGSQFKIVIQNDGVQFCDFSDFLNLKKKFFLLSKPWFLSYSDKQGQFWNPQNLRIMISITLM